MTAQLGSLSGAAGLAGGGGGLSLKNPDDLVVAMLKSRTVEDAMVQQFGLLQDIISDSISRQRPSSINDRHRNTKDGLIHIAVDDRNPQRAAELANGYVEQLRKLSEHLAITEAAQRRLFFEQQLEQAKNNLVTAEEALKQTEQQTGLIQLDSQARALIESAVSLRAQIAAKEVQIESLQTFATPQNAQLLQAQKELEGLRVQLAKLGGSEAESGTNLIVPKGKVPEAGMEYLRKYREVKYQETIFEILARQFEVAKLDEAREGALIQVVDSGIPPDARSSPKRTLIVLGATLFGLLVGAFTALLRAGLERLKGELETERKLNDFLRALSLRRWRPAS